MSPFPRIRIPSLIPASALLALLLACGGTPEGPQPATGVVREVDVAKSQVTIAHEDIPGLMQAMTMTFDVADAGALEGVAAGDPVDFEVEYKDGRYTVTSLAKR